MELKQTNTFKEGNLYLIASTYKNDFIMYEICIGSKNNQLLYAENSGEYELFELKSNDYVYELPELPIRLLNNNLKIAKSLKSPYEPSILPKNKFKGICNNSKSAYDLSSQ